MLTISDKAAEKVKAILQEKGILEGALRIFVMGGGGSGLQYGMALARAPEEDDALVRHDGVTLLIDPQSAPFLEGAEIDYVEDVMQSGFTILNPNAPTGGGCACGGAGCGCGH